MGEALIKLPHFFTGLGLKMQFEMICPKYSNSVRPNSYLVGFAKRELNVSLDKIH